MSSLPTISEAERLISKAKDQNSSLSELPPRVNYTEFEPVIRFLFGAKNKKIVDPKGITSSKSSFTIDLEENKSNLEIPRTGRTKMFQVSAFKTIAKTNQ